MGDVYNTRIKYNTMNLQIPHNDIVRYLGGETNERLEHKIEVIQEEAQEWLEPDVSYVHYPTGELGDLRSYKVEKAIQGCDQVVLYVATLGTELDEHIQGLIDENHYLDAYVLDAIGSAGAEALANTFHEEWEGQMQDHDRGVTLRFSPGYCDWDLEDQEVIFDSVDTEVELNDSYLMTPAKSTSGLFGITEEPCESITNYNPCLTCKKLNCQMRRVEQ
jgi:hypothetical protein